MAELKRSFLKGVMNKDVDERILPDGQVRDALNIDIAHSEGDDAGAARNMKGNTKLGDLGNIAGASLKNARTIGACTSESDNLIYYLVASDAFDGIYEYSELTGNITRVVQSNKATVNSISKLNFNQDYYVTGINFFDGFIFWTDNLNEPRRLKVARAKSYNIDDDRIDQDIRVIKPAPLNAPMIDMEQETDQENNLEERFLQFAIRYKYVDDQYSAFSPFSGVAFVPDEYTLDYGAGENKSMLNTKNRVKISFETGGEFVEEIELLFRDTKDQNISVVESFNKEQLSLLDNNIHEFTFANNKVYRVLSADQLTRLFDNVPLKAKAQDVIDRRVVYGNYVQFYDIKDSDGSKIKLDLNLSHVNRYWVSGDLPLQTFRSDRDYEIGIQYGDADGRFTTTLTSENNTTYIPPNRSTTSNSLFVEIGNEPPDFATNYRVVIKQNKKEFYNIFPILYYASGMYRYFLVNDFDLDKVRVGDYVVFKADLDGPTQTNKKYKVLEFEQKAGNFLNLNNSNEIPGLYFKIKVDDSSEFNPNAVFEHTHTGNGTNYLSSQLTPNVTPVRHRFAVAEKPIHYGDGDPDIVYVVNNAYLQSSLGDLRLTLEITSQTEFRYTFDYVAASGWIYETLTPNTTIDIMYTTLIALQIVWTDISYYTVGDKWKISCRSEDHLSGNYFGGVGIPLYDTQMTYGDWGGGVVLPGPGWSATTPEVDTSINAGAVISIDVSSDTGNVNQQAGIQWFPPSPRRYENIEEWFVESGAYDTFSMQDLNNIDVGSQAVTFRRGIYTEPFSVGLSQTTYNWSGSTNFGYIYQGGGNVTGSPLPNVDNIYDTQGITNVLLDYPVHMIIQGFGIESSNGDANIITATISIQQTDNLSICETEPKEADSEIYHETTRTYPIANGLHKVLWEYLDYTAPSWSNIDGTGYTNIGQLDPEGDPDNTTGLVPHYFQVGDRIEISGSSGLVQNVVYSVLHVPNKYNIVINQAFSSGATIAGKVGYYHEQAIERNQTASLPAGLLINPAHQFDIFNVDGTLKASLVSDVTPGNTNGTYNAYTFGNGLETDRIRDNFNSTTIEYSPRTSAVVEDYQQERKDASLTYSGVYRADTSVNRLNEFNLSNRNFKNLDLEFGSVQKLYARDTDLMVFHADKMSRVLYGKNILSDAVGGGSVTSVPEVLGTQISYSGEWGISFNPESFAQWANNLYWVDSRRGAVLSMTPEGIIPISNAGMKDYFRDLLKDNPNTQKIGAFDPYKRHYVLASNSNTSKPCDLYLSKDGFSFSSAGQDGIETVLTKPDFFVFSNTSWSVSIVYSAGSGWVTGYPTSGFGDQAIFLGVADNNTASTRTATITFTYCGGLTATYVVTQAAGEEAEVVVWVVGPVRPVKPIPVP